MNFTQTDILGCYQVVLNDFNDLRGGFFKTFHFDFFKEKKLTTDWKEEYFSTSKKNVIRGMHFQTPPEDHAKLVTCLTGSVIDVIVDLRKDSETFKKHISILLDASSKNKMIYIPKGCAHGFLSLEDNTLMHYKVSSVYSAEKDMGILWSTIGFDWKCDHPIISERDKRHTSLHEFQSPF
ncbi:MAG: dTDP-4-dehydrorhamnose 3,5-epimerase family protein [Maribacter sp.]